MNRTQLFRYLGIGLTAFLIEYAVFTLLIYLGTFLLVAQTVSFCVGLIVSFMGNRTLTFKGSAYTHSRSAQFWRYLTLALFNIVFSNGLIYALVEQFGIEPLLSKVIVMIVIVCWNYIIFSKIIFRRN